MANTERLAVLQQVTLAKESVSKQRVRPSLDDDARDVLNDLFEQLNDLQNELILADLSEAIKSLQKQSGQLAKVATKLKEGTKALAQLSKQIQEVAEVVGVLADIAAKASSAGLA